MPLISIGMLLLFMTIPRIDPLKKNIEKFRKYFDTFIVFMLGFLFYIHLLTILWNTGYELSMNIMIIPAVAALFYYCGVLIENARRNWFIGIRTPWTLSSDNVWRKTHKRGGKLFKIAGLIALIGLAFQKLAMWFVLIPVLSVAGYTILYSYLEFQKENKKS